MAVWSRPCLVYQTGGPTEGPERDYFGAVKVGLWQSESQAKANRHWEHSTGRARGAVWLSRVTHLRELVTMASCASWGEALELELVWTIWGMRRRGPQGYRVVRGGPLVRPTPSEAETALRRLLLKSLPREGQGEAAALAWLRAADLGWKARLHFEGKCFHCAASGHLIVSCPNLDRAPAEDPGATARAIFGGSAHAYSPSAAVAAFQRGIAHAWQVATAPQSPPSAVAKIQQGPHPALRGPLPPPPQPLSGGLPAAPPGPRAAKTAVVKKAGRVVRCSSWCKTFNRASKCTTCGCKAQTCNPYRPGKTFKVLACDEGECDYPNSTKGAKGVACRICKRKGYSLKTKPRCAECRYPRGKSGCKVPCLLCKRQGYVAAA